MNKKAPFQITAEQNDKTAHIRIIGHIGWSINSESFRLKVDELVEKGCTKAHLYINSPGGSCFDANEIINILRVFKGNITGEGGAIVASAAAYIATQCDSFEMPENGKMMIHKPAGGVSGTAEKIENYLKLLKDLDNEYYTHFLNKTTEKATFKKQWLKGDYWLTAKEAKKAGYINKVKKQIQVDDESKAMIEACMGCTPKQTEKTPKLDTNMDELQKLIVALLGLQADASLEAIGTKVQEVVALNETLQKERDNLQTKVDAFEQKEKDKQTAEAKVLVAEAVKQGKLDAKGTEAMLKLFATDHDAGKAALEAIPTTESIVEKIKKGAESKTESAWEKRKKEIEEANKN